MDACLKLYLTLTTYIVFPSSHKTFVLMVVGALEQKACASCSTGVQRDAGDKL